MSGGRQLRLRAAADRVDGFDLAPTGRLSLKITDQAGTITTTPPVTVARGGDFFLLSSTFVVPDSSVEVCRPAILEVGAVTIAEPHSKTFPLWCIPIRR